MAKTKQKMSTRHERLWSVLDLIEIDPDVEFASEWIPLVHALAEKAWIYRQTQKLPELSVSIGIEKRQVEGGKDEGRLIIRRNAKVER